MKKDGVKQSTGNKVNANYFEGKAWLMSHFEKPDGYNRYFERMYKQNCYWGRCWCGEIGCLMQVFYNLETQEWCADIHGLFKRGINLSDVVLELFNEIANL